jgi:hypothetical protein
MLWAYYTIIALMWLLGLGLVMTWGMIIVRVGDPAKLTHTGAAAPQEDQDDL